MKPMKGGPITEWIAEMQSLLARLKKYEHEKQPQLESAIASSWAKVHGIASAVLKPSAKEAGAEMAKSQQPVEQIYNPEAHRPVAPTPKAGESEKK